MKVCAKSACQLTIGLGLLTMLFASAAQAQVDARSGPEASTKTMTLSDSSLLDLRTEQALKRTINCLFDEEPLSDVLDVIKEEANLNFVIPKDNEFYLDELVSLRVTNVPLYLALEMVLAQMDATYCIQDGVVVIIEGGTCMDPLYVRTKMFDCTELIKVMKVPNPQGRFIQGSFGAVLGAMPTLSGVFAIPPKRKSTQGGAPQENGGVKQPAEFGTSSLRGGGALVDDRPQTEDEVHHQKCDELIDLVLDTADLTDHVRIRFIGGVMVVSGDEYGLRKTANILIDLHAAKKLAMPGRPKSALKFDRSKRVASSASGEEEPEADD